MDMQALADFGQVNRTGFRKALKKHDKARSGAGRRVSIEGYRGQGVTVWFATRPLADGGLTVALYVTMQTRACDFPRTSDLENSDALGVADGVYCFLWLRSGCRCWALWGMRS